MREGDPGDVGRLDSLGCLIYMFISICPGARKRRSVRLLSSSIAGLDVFGVPLFQIPHILRSLLRIRNHLNEEVCKCRPTKLRILTPVQISVVYRLLIRRVSQARRLACSPAHCDVLPWCLRLDAGLRTNCGNRGRRRTRFRGARRLQRRWVARGVVRRV